MAGDPKDATESHLPAVSSPMVIDPASYIGESGVAHLITDAEASVAPIDLLLACDDQRERVGRPADLSCFFKQLPDLRARSRCDGLLQTLEAHLMVAGRNDAPNGRALMVTHIEHGCSLTAAI